MKDTLSRRRFLQAASALGLASFLPLHNVEAQATPLLPDAPRYSSGQRARALGTTQQAYTFFNPHEAAFVESFTERLIPTDDLGAGAITAGVPYFIDQQLQSAFGMGAKWYLRGPWFNGTAEQGYQMPLNPQQVYRIGIPAIDMYCEERYGRVFSVLSAFDQDAVITALEEGNIDLPEVPAAILEVFFGFVRENAMEGFFSDPAYGGNRDKVGWEMVNYPGVAAAYRGVMADYYNRPYEVTPVSIGEIQQRSVETDDEGHAVHRDRLTGLPIEGTRHEH